MRAELHSWSCEPWCSRADRCCRLRHVQPPLMKSGAPIPPGQKSAGEAHCFPAECQKMSLLRGDMGQSQWGGNVRHKCYLFIHFFYNDKMKFQLFIRYKVRRASGAINSSAGGLMKTSSLKCHLHRDHLSHSWNIPPAPWHERYKNAIRGEAKSIMWCVMRSNDRNTTSYYTFWPRPPKCCWPFGAEVRESDLCVVQRLMSRCNSLVWWNPLFWYVSPRADTTVQTCAWLLFPFQSSYRLSCILKLLCVAFHLTLTTPA